MKRFSGAMLVACVFSSLAATASHAQLMPVRERLGGRVGYVATGGGLNDSYGNGWHATLHFEEQAYGPFFVDIRLGAIYLGDLRKIDLARQFVELYRMFPASTLTRLESSMRLLFITVGPQYVRPMGAAWMGYLSTGLGIYSVSVLFDSGVAAADVSQQRFGGNASIGALLHIAGGWNIDMNVAVHHFRTKKRPNELFYIFTESDANPTLVQATVGVTLDLR